MLFIFKYKYSIDGGENPCLPKTKRFVRLKKQAVYDKIHMNMG